MPEPPRTLSERLGKSAPERHMPPRELVAQNQRERLLQAIAEQVAERGYAKTTIEAIAKSARVAVVTFYENFSSKEECFLAAFDQNVADAAEVFAQLSDSQRPWFEQVAKGLEVFLELVEAEPERAHLCIVASQAAGATALGRYQAMLERVAERLRQGRELNPRASRLPQGLEVALAGGLAWLVYQRLVAGQAEGMRVLLPEMLQVTLTPYVGEAEARRAAAEAQARVAA